MTDNITSQNINLSSWDTLYIVNTVSNQCKVETMMLLRFCCFLLIQGESC